MKVTRIVQSFPEDSLPDVAATLREELRSVAPRIARPLRGARVAVAVGSRGIADLALIVRELVSWLRGRGALPFIVPAMGSHGGATAEGQRELLRGYGVQESTVGAPVVSSLEVVELPSEGLGNRVFVDAAAAGADGTVVVARVKPHTDFHGPVESGLLKMCVVGLGKHRAALEMHGFGVEGLRTRIGPTALRVLEHGNILFGVGIVENARDRIRLLRALLPAEIPLEEPRLLELARASMARLPVEELDVLVVDELGKDVSGTGMDTNVIGRMRIPGEPEPSSPRVRRIVLLGLTAATHGNALGMGLADVVTRRMEESVDFPATYENVLTSSFLERGHLPLVAATPREAVEWALRSLGRIVTDRVPRIARIKNTLRLGELWVSDPVLDALAGDPRIAATAEAVELLRSDGELGGSWREA